MVFLTEAPQQDSQRKVMSRDKSEKIRGMLKSITSEIKVGPNSNRELVFSNCEVEQIQSRKSFDKFAHSKALFNFNKKQLMIDTSNDAASTKNMSASGLNSTRDLLSGKNGFSGASSRPPLSTRSGARSRR